MEQSELDDAVKLGKREDYTGGTSGRNSGVKSEITKQGIPVSNVDMEFKQKNRCQCLTRTEEKV